MLPSLKLLEGSISLNNKHLKHYQKMISGLLLVKSSYHSQKNYFRISVTYTIENHGVILYLKWR
ncbi:hypothetical protein BH23THE1_BH23THE1_06670 [soil metagenome]